MSEKKQIHRLQKEGKTFPPDATLSSQAWVKSIEDYETKNHEALHDTEAYWGERASELLTWFSDFEKVLEADYDKPDFKWYIGGKTNAAYNCLDRHIANGRGDKAALIWQGEPEADVRVYTYEMLHTEVCRFANVLKKKGVKRGDRVSLYMPMIPELVIAMLACARIGAPHAIVFAGFSSVALQSRIENASAKVLVTADAVLRAGKTIPLKPNVDEALEKCPSVTQCIVVKRSGNSISMIEGRDSWWHDEMAANDIDSECPCEEMDAEDPLFILYTSGSTGSPKGVLHSTGGYLTYAAHSTQYVFDIKENDVYWCTADIGWITGHSYIVYGPLTLGATSVMFEGVPSFPKPDRLWQIVQKFKVTIFYTAPTVIRALMREGQEWTSHHDTSSLRILGSVGEPINPEAWLWFHSNIGKGKLPIVDTWWQTETGGIMIAAMPYATPLKPGSATRPLPGIAAKVVRRDGTPAQVNEGGHLIIDKPWPGMLRQVWGDAKRYKSTYFTGFPNAYESGDGAYIDADGYFWIMGRLDDVINVSGHRMGTAEIESALVAHSAVSEAAVVGMPHDIKGESIYAYVTLKSDIEPDDAMIHTLRTWVRQEIGPIATPEYIQFTEGLPKTRSGKIMRRILRKIVEGSNEFGDTSTLADPSVVTDLVEGNRDLTHISSI